MQAVNRVGTKGTFAGFDLHIGGMTRLPEFDFVCA